MADQITYYAMFDADCGRTRPRTAFRRVARGDGTADELFSGEPDWEPSTLLLAAERGDTMFDFAEISETEADQIASRVRAQLAREA